MIQSGLVRDRQSLVDEQTDPLPAPIVRCAEFEQIGSDTELRHDPRLIESVAGIAIEPRGSAPVEFLRALESIGAAALHGVPPIAPIVADLQSAGHPKSSPGSHPTPPQQDP